MGWRESIENQFLPKVRHAISDISGAVESVEIDFLNACVTVTTSAWPPDDERQAIRKAVNDIGRAWKPEVQHWPTHIRSRTCYPFTSHVRMTSHTLVPSIDEAAVLVFDVPYSALMSLRDGEEALRKEAQDVDFVATFAAGGTGTLVRMSWMYWETIPRSHPMVVPAEMTRIAPRHNLFPGLTWSQTDREAEGFVRWLEQLPSGCSVLIFDTGSKGNGPRTAMNVLERTIPQLHQFGPSRIRIVGLVDDEDDAQVSEAITIEHRNGAVECDIKYIHVAKVLAEDCQALLGYESNRQLGCLTPLRDCAVLRLLDDECRVIRVCATSKVMSLFHGLMSNDPTDAPAESAFHLTPERELAQVQTIAEYALTGELNQLEETYTWGIIDDRDFQGIKRGLRQRYRKAVEEYPKHRWDFDQKEFRRD